MTQGTYRCKIRKKAQLKTGSHLDKNVRCHRLCLGHWLKRRVCCLLVGAKLTARACVIALHLGHTQVLLCTIKQMHGIHTILCAATQAGTA